MIIFPLDETYNKIYWRIKEIAEQQQQQQQHEEVPTVSYPLDSSSTAAWDAALNKQLRIRVHFEHISLCNKRIMYVFCLKAFHSTQRWPWVAQGHML